MDRSLLTGILAGAAIVTAGGAIAGYKMLDGGDDYAQVTDVRPVTKTVSTPREVCGDEIVREQAPVKDEKRVTGTVIGAVVGGVLGSQVGSGDGRKAATAAGAAAGGYAGNKVQKRVQEGNTVDTVQERCETVYDSHEQIVGYDVRYTIDGDEGTVRMDRDPGARIAADELSELENIG